MPLFETLFPLGIAHYLIGGLLIGAAVSFLFQRPARINLSVGHACPTR